MFAEIADRLSSRRDLKGWTLRRIKNGGAQLFAVPKGVEARRLVSEEHLIVDVLRESLGADRAVTCGSGSVTIVAGDDIGAKLDAAVKVAGLARNEPYSLPTPAAVPDVPLSDPELQSEPEAGLEGIYSQLDSSARAQAQIRLTSAECFVEEERTDLLNSRGVEASQVATRVQVDWTLVAGEGGQEVESFVSIVRRRASDLDLSRAVDRSARHAVDRLRAVPARDYSGPVILRNDALKSFLLGGEGIVQGPLVVLTSAESKYKHFTNLELGKPLVGGEPAGDPLTIWANRMLPFGTRSNRFDSEGLSAQRLLLLDNNRLAAFTASQCYAHYLSLPATGEFGNLELGPGQTPAKQLTSGSIAEVAQFSWFYPDPLSGDFSCEIRLGYMQDETGRTPFRGGLLVGNVLEALADAYWSAETGFYGDYVGPTTARFGRLRISGESTTDGG